MNMNITISNVQNADEIGKFTPVSGEWTLHCDSDDRSRDGVEQSVCNWIDVDFALDVEIFHADGRAITGDIPSNGTFVAVRR